MRYQYIQPFVASTQKVLSEVGAGEPLAGAVELKSTPVLCRGVTAIVGVTGEGEGRVFFDMSPETARQISAVMNGKKADEVAGLVQDTIAELASMITGCAISALNNGGHPLRISPPTLIAGTNVTISSPALETLVVPVRTPWGELVVNVAIATA